MLQDHPDRAQFMSALDAALDAEELGDDGEMRRQKDEAKKLLNQQQAAEEDLMKMGGDDSSLVDLQSAMQELKMRRLKDKGQINQDEDMVQQTYDSIRNGETPDAPDAIRKDLMSYNEEHLRCLCGIIVEAGILSNLKKWMRKDAPTALDWRKSIEPIISNIGGKVEEEFHNAQNYGDFVTQIEGWKNDLIDEVTRYSAEVQAWQDRLKEFKAGYAGITPDERTSLDNKLASSRARLGEVSGKLMDAGKELEDATEVVRVLEKGMAESFEEKLNAVLMEAPLESVGTRRTYRDIVFLTREIGSTSREMYRAIERKDPEAFQAKVLALKTHVGQANEKLAELVNQLSI